MSQYGLRCAGFNDGADSIFVYVTAGPDGNIARAFFSSTSIDRFCAACAMFADRRSSSAGVCAPSVLDVAGGNGVVAPEFTCVAIDDASFLEDSDRSCLTFLLRRCEGRQFGLRKGRRVWAMSRRSRSFWWASLSAGVGTIVSCLGSCRGSGSRIWDDEER